MCHMRDHVCRDHNHASDHEGRAPVMLRTSLLTLRSPSVLLKTVKHQREVALSVSFSCKKVGDGVGNCVCACVCVI